MDEAAARLRMAVDSKPEALDRLDREIMQLKIEREALKKETDEASKERLKKLEGELVELEEAVGRPDGALEVARRTAVRARRSSRTSSMRARSRARQRAAPAAITQKAGELAYGRHPRAREEARRTPKARAAGARWSRRR